jgi:predicted anti-sigma-YlaC factor YlaD
MQRYFGLLFSIVLVGLLVVFWWQLDHSAQNKFKTVYLQAIQHTPLSSSKYYSAKYIHIIKKENARQAMVISPDSVFLQSLLWPIYHSGQPPVMTPLASGAISASFTITDTVDFLVTYYCVPTDSGLVFDSISGYAILLSRKQAQRNR